MIAHGINDLRNSIKERKKGSYKTKYYCNHGKFIIFFK